MRTENFQKNINIILFNLISNLIQIKINIQKKVSIY